VRVLVELRASCDCVYDLKYHHKLQGFLYSLLKGSDYENLHNRLGYKFFSFSNIFPPKDMRKGDVRHLLIASPDTKLISVFTDHLSRLNCTNIGEMSFRVESISVLMPKVRRSCTLITGTPIVVRIPRTNYAKYGINPPKEYPYVYWRKQYPFNAFIKQLEDNLFKKYNMFHNTSMEVFPLFEQFTFQKQVCNHIIIKGREVKVFGSLWKFIFSNLYKEKRKTIQFGLDTGFARAKKRLVKGY
jgi:CRISPR-associated endoribonuclease Cas6